MHSVHSLLALCLVPNTLLTLATVVERDSWDSWGETVTVTKTNTNYVCPCDPTSLPTWLNWQSTTAQGTTSTWPSHATYTTTPTTISTTTSTTTSTWTETPIYPGTTTTSDLTTQVPTTTYSIHGTPSSSVYDLSCSDLSTLDSDRLSSLSDHCSSYTTIPTSTDTGEDFMVMTTRGEIY